MSAGHQVVLLPPHQVRPYVTRNKTDRTDAKGILEAYRNADIRPVPVKSVPQQVLVTLHRFRSGWLGARTAHLNTLRGLLRELGIVIPVGADSGDRLLIATALVAFVGDIHRFPSGRHSVNHVMAKQVGPASGKPITSLAFEAAFAVLSLFATTDSEPVPVSSLQRRGTRR